MQSSRSAPAASACASLHRSAGQHLAEQHDVGLQRPRCSAARHAAPRRPRAARARRPAGSARRTSRHDERLDRPVHLDRARRVPALRCSMSMFCVMTASSDAARARARPARRGPRWAALSVERRGSGGRRTARSAPGRAATRRCARPPSGRRSPTARLPGVRKSGIPDGTEIPAPVSATTETGVAQQRRQGRRARAHLPCHSRLPLAEEGAEMPSRASSVANDRRRTRRSRPRAPRRGPPRARPA